MTEESLWLGGSTGEAHFARLARSDPSSFRERSEVEGRLVIENVGREFTLGNTVIANADNVF